jgi:PAP2 superfamily
VHADHDPTLTAAHEPTMKGSGGPRAVHVEFMSATHHRTRALPRGTVDPRDPLTDGGPTPRPWREVAAGPAVAVVTLIAALLATRAAGLPLRDPDHVASGRLAVTAGIVLLLVGLDVLVRAARRTRALRPSRAALVAVRRTRWTPGRALAVGSAVLSFYVTYMAYRNLKSVVPLLRPDRLFDGRLADVDRSLFAGHDPATLLHSALGTGIAAHLLSTVYLGFFLFVPLVLALALVFMRDLRPGVLLVTALSVNWALAAVSYFLLPSLGPIYAEPGLFAALPTTEVAHLQASLLEQRTAFLRDPGAPGAAQSIGAFASLHVSIFFTAAVATHVLRLRRAVKAAAWVLVGLTATATLYFGWHYALDDLGGMIIAVLSLGVARLLCGSVPHGLRRIEAVPA